MSSVDFKNNATPTTYTPAPGTDATEETNRTETTGAGQGAGGAGSVPPASDDTNPGSVPPGAAPSEDPLTDGDLQAFYGIDDSVWAQITPRDKEVMMKAMVQIVNQMSKQATDDIILNAASAQTANIAQAGELDTAAKKVLTQGIISLVAGAGLGLVGGAMQGVSAFKLAKSSAGETLKSFNAELKSMNKAANEAATKTATNIKEMSAEMKTLSDKAASGTLKAADIDAFKAKYGDQLQKVIGPENYKKFTDTLDKASANGLGLAAQDVAKEAFQDAQRQTAVGTKKAVKEAKAEARKTFIENSPSLKQATAQMDHMMAPLKKYDAIGTIAGAGEKSLNAGGTIAASESQAAQADAAREQAKAQQSTAQKDVVTEVKRGIDAFIQKLIEFLDRAGQVKADEMGAVTRGK